MGGEKSRHGVAEHCPFVEALPAGDPPSEGVVGTISANDHHAA